MCYCPKCGKLTQQAITPVLSMKTCIHCGFNWVMRALSASESDNATDSKSTSA
jgi:hypothetical protein